MNISVLVADSQRLNAEGLALGLKVKSNELHVIHDYPDTGRAALDAICRHRPNVALIDYWMPDMEGPAIVAQALAWQPSCKTILLSWLYKREHVQVALAEGAVGFLPKSVTIDHVVKAVCEAHAGAPLVLGNELAATVGEVSRRREAAKPAQDRVRTLSPRELEVLDLLACGCSKQDVSRRLSISAGTVRIHIQNLLKKLNARTQLEAIAVARHNGFVRDNRPTWLGEHIDPANLTSIRSTPDAGPDPGPQW